MTLVAPADTNTTVGWMEVTRVWEWTTRDTGKRPKTNEIHNLITTHYVGVHEYFAWAASNSQGCRLVLTRSDHKSGMEQCNRAPTHQKTYLGWFKRIICGEMNSEEKYSTLVGTVILQGKHSSSRSLVTTFNSSSIEVSIFYTGMA